MGFLGYNKIKTSTPMSIEELYEKIKDVDFEAGHPLVVNHALYNVIAFYPAVNNNNQVWITGKKGKFIVQRSQVQADFSDVAKNIAYEAAWAKNVTFNESQYKKYGKLPDTACMKLADLTAQRLNELHL